LQQKTITNYYCEYSTVATEKEIKKEVHEKKNSTGKIGAKKAKPLRRFRS
jgi:hypothetical protein